MQGLFKYLLLITEYDLFIKTDFIERSFWFSTISDNNNIMISFSLDNIENMKPDRLYNQIMLGQKHRRINQGTIICYYISDKNKEICRLADDLLIPQLTISQTNDVVLVKIRPDMIQKYLIAYVGVCNDDFLKIIPNSISSSCQQLIFGGIFMEMFQIPLTSQTTYVSILFINEDIGLPQSQYQPIYHKINNGLMQENKYILPNYCDNISQIGNILFNVQNCQFMKNTLQVNQFEIAPFSCVMIGEASYCHDNITKSFKEDTTFRLYYELLNNDTEQSLYLQLNQEYLNIESHLFWKYIDLNTSMINNYIKLYPNSMIFLATQGQYFQTNNSLLLKFVPFHFLQNISVVQASSNGNQFLYQIQSQNPTDYQQVLLKYQEVMFSHYDILQINGSSLQLFENDTLQFPAGVQIQASEGRLCQKYCLIRVSEGFVNFVCGKENSSLSIKNGIFALKIGSLFNLQMIYAYKAPEQYFNRAINFFAFLETQLAGVQLTTGHIVLIALAGLVLGLTVSIVITRLFKLKRMNKLHSAYLQHVTKQIVTSQGTLIDIE